MRALKSPMAGSRSRKAVRAVTITDLLELPSTANATLRLGDRLAELMYKNGGSPQVSGWGVIEIGGAYGSQGLEQEEALELIHMAGVIRGFLMNAAPGSEHELGQWIQKEWAKRGVELKS
jgi:hypothetical protein